MNIGELFIALSFNSDLTALTTLGTGLKTSQKLAMGLKDGVLSLTYALDKLVSSSLQTASDLQTFSNQTDISIQKLQQWQYYANQSNVSNQGLKSSILGIQQAQSAVMMGGGNLRPWQILGIRPTDDPFVVIDKLRERIKGLPAGISMSLISQMGLSPDMINLIKNGSFEMGNMAKKFMLTSKEERNLLSLNKIFKDLGFSIKGAGERLIAMNYKPIERFFGAIKDAVTFIFDLAKGTKFLCEKFEILKSILIVLAGLVVVIALFNPITFWIIAAGILLLLLADIYGYFHGKNSLTGEIIESFNTLDIVKKFKSMKKDFDELGKSFHNAFDKPFKELEKAFEKLFGKGKKIDFGGIFSDIFKSFLEGLAQTVLSLVKGLTMLFDILSTLQEKGLSGFLKDEKMKSRLSDYAKSLGDFLLDLPSDLLKGLTGGKSGVLPPTISARAKAGSSNTNVIHNHNNTNHININESKHPIDTQKHLQSELNKKNFTQKDRT